MASNGNDFVDFLKWGGPLIVAIIALAQPWAIGVYQRFIRQADIDVYEGGTIEICYAAAGTTISLQGTLRAVHHDQFVREIGLELVRLSDQSRHTLEWAAFYPSTSPVGQSSVSSIEVPSGFMLTVGSPHKYRIQFLDRPQYQEVSSLMEELRSDYGNTLLAAYGGSIPQSLAPSVAQSTADQAFETFRTAATTLNKYGELDRLCYWFAGDYALSMTVTTARPERHFSRSWRFTLKQADVDKLRLNRVIILEQVAGRTASQLHFAYSDYQSPE